MYSTYVFNRPIPDTHSIELTATQKAALLVFNSLLEKLPQAERLAVLQGVSKRFCPTCGGATPHEGCRHNPHIETAVELDARRKALAAYNF